MNGSKAIFVRSADDPRIAAYRDLPNRKDSAEFVIAEGRWLVERLLASDLEVVSVFCAEQCRDEFHELLSATPLYVASRDIMEQVVGFRFHRGVLACARRSGGLTTEMLCASAATRSLVVVCDGVSDRENLGALVRTSAAFDVHGLIVGPRCADPLARRVLRVSMGASLQVPTAVSADLAADLAILREHRFRVVAATLGPDATPIDDVDRVDRMVIVFGNEGYGVSAELLAQCDQEVTIPMSGAVDSLNVAVSAGIFLHRFQRRSCGADRG